MVHVSEINACFLASLPKPSGCGFSSCRTQQQFFPFYKKSFEAFPKSIQGKLVPAGGAAASPRMPCIAAAPPKDEGLPGASLGGKEGDEAGSREEKGLSPSRAHGRCLCFSLAALRDLGLDPCCCYLRLSPAAAGMGDVCIPHLLPHLPAAPPKLHLWLSQKQQQLESAGKDGLRKGPMVWAAAAGNSSWQ